MPFGRYIQMSRKSGEVDGWMSTGNNEVLGRHRIVERSVAGPVIQVKCEGESRKRFRKVRRLLPMI